MSIAALHYGDPINRSHPLMRGIVARWKVVPWYMSGPRFINLANYGRSHGVLAGGAAFVPSRVRPGGYGYVSFDGTNDSVQAALNLAAFQKATFSFWLWWDSYGSADDLAMEFTADGGANNGGFYIDPDTATSVIRIEQKGDAGSNKVTFARPSAAAWHHWLINFDLSKTSNEIDSVYIDGVSQTLAYETNFNSSNNLANSTLNFMCRNNASLFGDGRMDDVLVLGGRILSAEDAKGLYWATRQTFDPTLSWSRPAYLFGVSAGGVSEIAGTAAITFGEGSSTLTGAGALAGTAAITFGEGSSTLTGAGALAGVAALTFGEGSSTLTGAGAVAGTAAVVFGEGSSTLTGAGALAGAAAITFTGLLSAPGDLTGTTAITIDATGTLTGTGALAGTAAITFDATLTPSIAGTATITIGATGTIVDLNAPTSVAVQLRYVPHRVRECFVANRYRERKVPLQ